MVETCRTLAEWDRKEAEIVGMIKAIPMKEAVLGPSQKQKLDRFLKEYKCTNPHVSYV